MSRMSVFIECFFIKLFKLNTGTSITFSSYLMEQWMKTKTHVQGKILQRL